MPGVFFFLGVRNQARKISAMVHTEYLDPRRGHPATRVRAMSSIVLDYLQRD